MRGRHCHIGFTKLGSEECAVCTEHANHPCSGNTECECCKKQKLHIAARDEARSAFKADAQREWEPAEVVYSADMMRIFLLPQLPHTSCMFTSRLVAYNETFSPVGTRIRGEENAPRSMSIVWHEGTAGRDAPDITSAFIRFRSPTTSTN